VSEATKSPFADDPRVRPLMAKMKLKGVKDRTLTEKFFMQAALANLPHWNVKNDDAIQQMDLAVTSLTHMKPKSTIETMLAVQMLAVHDASLIFLTLATKPEAQESEVRSANVWRAARLMDVFTQQVAAMQKLKGKAARQKVTVEHVEVHRGGQAIVGSVMEGGCSKKNGKNPMTKARAVLPETILPASQRRPVAARGIGAGRAANALPCATDAAASMADCPPGRGLLRASKEFERLAPSTAVTGKRKNCTGKAIGSS
jgi:hypothetical protein